MKLIVGLGNPGPQYRNTRHNVGFLVVEELAKRWGVAFDQEKHGALLARAHHGGSAVLLLKPLTYMNRSGIAVASVARNRVPDLQDLLVVVDDINLPLGHLRMREGGSAGGHNGMKSCIEHLGTQEFPRLRIGVGENEAGSDLTDHVLGTFGPQERPAVVRSVERAANGVALFVESGVHRAMNEVNKKPEPGV